MVCPDTESGPLFLPEQRDVLHVLGYLQLQNGSPAKAAVIFDALAAADPSDPSLVLSHACALLRSGRSADALVLLDALTVDGEDLTLSWLLRGQALSQLGRVAEAARAMRMFIRHRHADEGRS